MKNNGPTDLTFRKMAKIFCKESNGTTIFPKLPSMLKTYYKRWEQNHKIKVAEKTVSIYTK